MPRLLFAVLPLLLCALPARAQNASPQDPGVRPVTRTFAITDARVDRLTEIEKDEGIWIGFWDEADVERAKKAPKGRS